MKISKLILIALSGVAAFILLNILTNMLFPHKQPEYIGTWYGDVHVETPHIPSDPPGYDAGDYEG